MSYYYINRNPQSPPEQSEHEIHKDENCSHAPDRENRIGLGNFSDCRDATVAARRRFSDWKIDGCKYCNKECHRI